MINPVRIAVPIAVVILLAAAMIYLTGGWDGTGGSLPTTDEHAAQPFDAGSPIDEQVEAWKALIAANFAGDAACASCHVEEMKAHKRSGHSHTAVMMHDSQWANALLELATYEDPRRDQRFRFQTRDNQFTVQDVANPGTPAMPVTWLLGSGVHAQTPIWVDEQSQRGVEMRWSYLAPSDAIGVTPDHERFDDYRQGTIECYGRPLDNASVRACLACHTTMSPPPNLPIRQDLYIANVGCERCHGPRKKHVLMAEQGLAEQAKPLVTLDNPAAAMKVCVQCHRDADSVSSTATPEELVRFQPYGLKKSRCFIESAGKMGCSSCHDAHDAVSTDRSLYIERCQQCHQPKSSNDCPQMPTGDCIQCHMPAVEWTAGIEFHDHWIRSPE